jgi:hypothetical protein
MQIVHWKKLCTEKASREFIATKISRMKWCSWRSNRSNSPTIKIDQIAVIWCFPEKIHLATKGFTVPFLCVQDFMQNLLLTILHCASALETNSVHSSADRSSCWIEKVLSEKQVLGRLKKGTQLCSMSPKCWRSKSVGSHWSLAGADKVWSEIRCWWGRVLPFVKNWCQYKTKSIYRMHDNFTTI